MSIKEAVLKILMAGHGEGIRDEDRPLGEELRNKYAGVTYVEAGSSKEQIIQVRDCEV